jgi:hypothetical protein
VNGKNKNNQQDKEKITGELHILVGEIGNGNEDKSAANNIGPFNSKREKIRHINQQIPWIHEMKNPENKQDRCQYVYSKP